MSIKQTAKILIVSLGLTQLLMMAPALSTAASAADLECAVLPQSICAASDKGQVENSGIWLLLLLALNILTYGIGVVAVAMVGYAAFLYTTSGDNSQQTKNAIAMIRNVVVGIVAYAFMWAFLQYLIPGGIFK